MNDTIKKKLMLIFGIDDKALKAGLTDTEKRLSGLQKIVGALAATFAAVKIFNFAKDVALAAARAETLGVALSTVGRNAGYSVAFLNQTEGSLRKLGISLAEARTSMSLFIQSNLELTEITKLSRAAQDLAVIAGLGSSEAFQTLTEAIASQRPILLKQFGIVKELNQIYDDHAKTLGRSGDSLTQMEKKQAFLNTILAEGAKVQGVYLASMGTVGKLMGSLTSRAIPDMKVALGNLLLPVLKVVVEWMFKFAQKIEKLASGPEGAKFREMIQKLADRMKDFGDRVLKLIDELPAKIDTVMNSPLFKFVSGNLEEIFLIAVLSKALVLIGNITIALKTLGAVKAFEVLAAAVGGAATLGVGAAVAGTVGTVGYVGYKGGKAIADVPDALRSIGIGGFSGYGFSQAGRGAPPAYETDRWMRIAGPLGPEGEMSLLADKEKLIEQNQAAARQADLEKQEAQKALRESIYAENLGGFWNEGTSSGMGKNGGMTTWDDYLEDLADPSKYRKGVALREPGDMFGPFERDDRFQKIQGSYDEKLNLKLQEQEEIKALDEAFRADDLASVEDYNITRAKIEKKYAKLRLEEAEKTRSIESKMARTGMAVALAASEAHLARMFRLQHASLKAMLSDMATAVADEFALMAAKHLTMAAAEALIPGVGTITAKQHLAAAAKYGAAAAGLTILSRTAGLEAEETASGRGGVGIDGGTSSNPNGRRVGTVVTGSNQQITISPTIMFQGEVVVVGGDIAAMEEGVATAAVRAVKDALATGEISVGSR